MNIARERQSRSILIGCDILHDGEFPRRFQRLSKQMQKQARKAYRYFQADPNHPSLRFKKVHPTQPIYSARIGKGHRAVGVIDNDLADRASQLTLLQRGD